MAEAIESKQIEVRLVGEGIAPGTVRSREIAEVITSVEAMIAGVAMRDDPTLDPDDVVVGLSSIEPGSMKLGFGSPRQQQVTAAFVLIAAAIEEGRLTSLPNRTLRPLGAISEFAKRHDASAEFFAGEFESPIAVVTPTVEVPKPQFVGGDTVIYGQVIRTGGRKPRAMVETIAGDTIYCDASEEIIRDLGHQLYELVQLDGRALWDADDWKLTDFAINRVAAAGVRSKAAVMNDLTALVGDFFTDIDDAVGYVNELRSGDAE